jgi:hypothetical protein
MPVLWLGYIPHAEHDGIFLFSSPTLSEVALKLLNAKKVSSSGQSQCTFRKIQTVVNSTTFSLRVD